MKKAETKKTLPGGVESAVLLRSPSGEALVTVIYLAGTSDSAREGGDGGALSAALVRRGSAAIRRGVDEETIPAGEGAIVPEGWSVAAERGETVILRLSRRLADGCGVTAGDLPSPDSVIRIGGGTCEKLDRRVRAMESERGSRDGLGTLVLRSEGAAALAELLRALPGGAGIVGADSREREMIAATELIRENLAEVISIDELAEKAHMSRSSFYRAFRKHTGDTVNDYILKMRIGNAVTLMTAGKCGVLEAAYASGFTSSSGFYKAFRRICGATPKEYVAALRGEDSAQ